MKPAPSGVKAVADKVKALAKGIGWLSGSLAGICAILTVCGYLATMSHLHMLGLDVVASDFSTEFQLRRGGNFIFYVLAILSEKILLPLSILALFIVAACSFIGFLGSWEPFARILASVRSRFGIPAGRHPFRLRVLYVLLVLVLLWGMEGRIQDLLEPLSIEGLLFLQPETAPARSVSLFKAILQAESSELEFRFFEVVVYGFITAALLAAAWRTTEGLRLQWLLIAPFSLVFLIHFLFLPLTYGVLILKPVFPPVHIESTNSPCALSGGCDSLHLLVESREEFVFWNDESKRIVKVRREDIRAIEIGRGESILPRHTDADR